MNRKTVSVAATRPQTLTDSLDYEGLQSDLSEGIRGSDEVNGKNHAVNSWSVLLIQIDSLRLTDLWCRLPLHVRSSALVGD